MKKYLWRIKMRGVTYSCHASTSEDAMKEFLKQIGEPLYEYCLEWKAPTELDGTPLSEEERKQVLKF